MKKFFNSFSAFFKNNLHWLLPVVSVILIGAVILVVFNLSNNIPVDSKSSFIYDKNGNVIGTETKQTSGGRSDTETSYEYDTQTDTSYLDSANTSYGSSDPVKSNDINPDALELNLQNSSSSSPSTPSSPSQNPSSTVTPPPPPPFISQYSKGSTYPVYSPAASYTPDESITYKTVGSTELKMNVYYPAGGLKDKNVAVICIEGSAWVHKTSNWNGGKLVKTANYYANRGFVAITVCHRSIEYSDDTDVYDLLEDCADAYKYIKNELSYVNSDYMMLLGESAGGQLVLQLTLDPKYEVKPHTVIALNPVIDLNDKNKTGALQWEKTAKTTELRADASPVNSIRKNNTKYLVVHGKSDELIKYKSVTEFVQNMKDADNTCEIYAPGGMKHAFLVFDYILSSDKIVEHMKTIDTYVDDFLGIK